jgi:pantoate--beta-alanine ligase
MKICPTIGEMRLALQTARSSGKRVGFVPTMGALHEGHISLIRAAKIKCEVVVASIFVNPAQFGPNEDFKKYPRPFERDCEMLKQEGVDFLFAPTAEEMYPSGATTYVTVERISDRLDGGSRPGHFRGVTTVVSKLFNIVQPGFAFFGQKDAAQHAILRRMVRDLNLPVEIVVCPIVREPDGLAMSSRNVYLSSQERISARVLCQALSQIEGGVQQREYRVAQLIESGKRALATEPSVRLDYLAIVDPDTLEQLEKIEGSALVAVAAFVGVTRLIDNVVVTK